MRTLLLGSGGRESALAWALDGSPSVSELIVAPGNAGISRFAELVDGDIEDPNEVVDLARRIGSDLVVVGPEAPLVAGVADALRADGRAVFGPNRSAARIEGSKEYAKSLMDDAGIPTATWRSFDEVATATRFLDELGPPYVVKADGLAAGKGVVVTEDRTEAVEALKDRLQRGAFGIAGSRVVIEEFLDGEEASLIAFTDGVDVVACVPAQDYKRVLDGDGGPNTGGMGSYSPVPSCPPEVADRLVDDVLRPMVLATADAGAHFVGALYAGLALTSKGPKVVEFNARFGDPETQALMPRLRSDLGEICMACATASLEGTKLEWAREACVAVVLASDGYPGSYATGQAIAGLDEVAELKDVHVFHAGTARRGDDIVTAGGRVLAVSALVDSFAHARRRAYEAAEKIHFEGVNYRSDIALRAERYEETQS